MAIAVHDCVSRTAGALYQEQLYGRGHRVVNPVGKGATFASNRGFRCTCCGVILDRPKLVNT